jgi:hypothetical protein
VRSRREARSGPSWPAGGAYSQSDLVLEERVRNAIARWLASLEPA